MIQCVLWAVFPGMLAENRVIAISPSCQLYFNCPPLTFGKMRSNRNHQPALFVYTSVWLFDPAILPALSALQHIWDLWNYSGRKEQGKAWSNFVLWVEKAGVLPAAWPAKWAVPKSIACCVFWQAVVPYCLLWCSHKGGCLDCKQGVKSCTFLSLPSCACPILNGFIEWWDKIDDKFFRLAKPEPIIQFIPKECCICVLCAYISHVLWEWCRCKNINLQCPLFEV